MLLMCKKSLLGFFLLICVLNSGHCSPFKSLLAGVANLSNKLMDSKGRNGKSSVVAAADSSSELVSVNVNSTKTNTNTKGSDLSAGFFSMLASVPWKDIVEEVVLKTKWNSNAGMMEGLEKLKTQLIKQFATKADELPIQSQSQGQGQSLTEKESGRAGYGGYGAHGFPSLEGALLSIAFLTFAVFLIDLIQQLLSRIRTGTAGVVPLVGRRKKRNAVLEDEDDHLISLTSNILNSLENPLKYQ